MSDTSWVRIGILAAGLLLIAAIYFFGRPSRPAQGRRRNSPAEPGRQEPPSVQQGQSWGDGEDMAADSGRQGELALAETAAAVPELELGKRVQEDFGMTYGHMQVFHRLLEGKPEAGPVFSMASILKPGSFDMATISQMETPAIAFFLTLPAPLPALDAWEKMEPTVQRMAELLDAVVLDDGRNALGRQRIAHIRDELRAYDRQHEAPPLTKPPRW